MPSDWALKIAWQTTERWWANEEEAQKIPWIQVCAEALDAARAQGKREGLEEAAHVALSTAARINEKCERMAKGADLVAAEIRARIEQPAAQEPTRVAIELSGEQLYLLIKFIQAFAGQSSVESAPQLRSIAEKLRARIEEPAAREGLEEKQGAPVGWRYRVLVDRHSTGNPQPGEICMLDINRVPCYGVPGRWEYYNGPDKPAVDWMCTAEPLYARLDAAAFRISMPKEPQS